MGISPTLVVLLNMNSLKGYAMSHPNLPDDDNLNDDYGDEIDYDDDSDKCPAGGYHKAGEILEYMVQDGSFRVSSYRCTKCGGNYDVWYN
jgi:hypothetical protein